MSNQQALLDFLTYSYFKIVPKEIYGDRGQTDYSDYCIKKAIMKAYEDATNEGAYIPRTGINKKLPLLIWYQQR